MNKKTKNIITSVLFLGFLAVNVAIFLSQINLADRTRFYELETQRLKKENILIQKQLNANRSLIKIASQAAELDYDHLANPVFLKDLHMAME